MSDADVKDRPTNKRRRWWRWPLRIILVLLLSFAVFRVTVYLRVQSRLNAIRAAGYPATPVEHEAWYAYPTGPNAADVY